MITQSRGTLGSNYCYRTFQMGDQKQFASVSGDFNPIHVDPAVARRTAAGSLVVHGVHNLLWCMNCVLAHVPDSASIASLRVNFDAVVTVNERVDAILVMLDETRLRAEVRSSGVLVLTVQVTFSGKVLSAPFEKPAELFNPTEPIDFPDHKIDTIAGRVSFASSPLAMLDLFPVAARKLGARRVAALGALTRLIGMVCPGLHSIFNNASLEACEDDGADDIGFRIANANSERRFIRLAAWGGGWAGTLTSTKRHPPTVQPSIVEIAKTVGSAEFARTLAVVVGGSRGLGEVVAKLIAAGGGNPTITYSVGQHDALRVAEEIHKWGGCCEVVKLDVTEPIAEQLAGIRAAPEQLFYFATPMIRNYRGSLFRADRLGQLTRFYVDGFYNTCLALLRQESSASNGILPIFGFHRRPACWFRGICDGKSGGRTTVPRYECWFKIFPCRTGSSASSRNRPKS